MSTPVHHLVATPLLLVNDHGAAYVELLNDCYNGNASDRCSGKNNAWKYWDGHVSRIGWLCVDPILSTAVIRHCQPHRYPYTDNTLRETKHTGATGTGIPHPHQVRQVAEASR